MRLNADFSRRVVVRPEDYRWVDSPMPGVKRMMLDRIGEEVARATSLVRYAPDSTFSQHVHTGGEEFFVLEGEFGDEHGAYPAGTYVRNPIGTEHSPRVGEEGCTIFVKLQQFANSDHSQFSVDTRNADWAPGRTTGLEEMHLHEFGDERVMLMKWAPDAGSRPLTNWGGEEIFVIEGTLFDEHGEYPAGSWIRSPHRSTHTPYAKDDGALTYVKTGHLVNN